MNQLTLQEHRTTGRALVRVAADLADLGRTLAAAYPNSQGMVTAAAQAAVAVRHLRRELDLACRAENPDTLHLDVVYYPKPPAAPPAMKLGIVDEERT